MPKRILEKKVELFNGTINTISPELIKEGASSNSRNFLTFTDHIELTRGRKLVGAEETTANPVLGLHSIQLVDGTDLLFRKIGTVLQYYNTTTGAWTDSKTGLTDGAEMSFANSFTPAGRQVWCCSIDGLFKIYPSSPATVVDLTSATKNDNVKGKILIEKSRMIAWGAPKDPTGLYISKVDKDANYTLVATEAVGALGTKTYAGTLAKGQMFGLVVTDGTQTLTDQKDGTLTGSGTGTINYATGAYSVTFTDNTTGAVTASYLWEDSLTNGLADFGYSATRLAGEGNIQRQDALGSTSLAVHTFSDMFFTLQDKGSWQVTVSADDLTWDNDVLRQQSGTASPWASVATANGIVYVDTFDPESPKLKLLGYDKYNTLIVPYDLSIDSDGIGFDLTKYYFDKSAMVKFGDLCLFSCRTVDSLVNDKTIVYNLKLRSFGVLENGYNFFAVANSKLYGGDSSSPNVYELFSGWDDLEYLIEGEWEGNDDRLGTEQLKKLKKLIIAGYISSDQAFDIYAGFDNGDYELLGEVLGTGSYIDAGNSQTVGETMSGVSMIGGGGTDSEVFYYMRQLKLNTTKFRKIKLKFVPKGLGYLSIYFIKYSDFRLKQFKLPKKYL